MTCRDCGQPISPEALAAAVLMGVLLGGGGYSSGAGQSAWREAE
jgi:hypothetical protein